jgi:hypothetical protein
MNITTEDGTREILITLRQSDKEVEYMTYIGACFGKSRRQQDIRDHEMIAAAQLLPFPFHTYGLVKCG